jgi:hypothetical protein
MSILITRSRRRWSISSPIKVPASPRAANIHTYRLRIPKRTIRIIFQLQLQQLGVVIFLIIQINRFLSRQIRIDVIEIGRKVIIRLDIRDRIRKIIDKGSRSVDIRRLAVNCITVIL